MQLGHRDWYQECSSMDGKWMNETIKTAHARFVQWVYPFERSTHGHKNNTRHYGNQLILYHLQQHRFSVSLVRYYLLLFHSLMEEATYAGKAGHCCAKANVRCGEAIKITRKLIQCFELPDPTKLKINFTISVSKWIDLRERFKWTEFILCRSLTIFSPTITTSFRLLFI